MPNNVTDSATWEATVQSIADGEECSATNHLVGIQDLANRTAFLNQFGHINKIQHKKWGTSAKLGSTISSDTFVDTDITLALDTPAIGEFIVALATFVIANPSHSSGLSAVLQLHNDEGSGTDFGAEMRYVPIAAGNVITGVSLVGVMGITSAGAQNIVVRARKQTGTDDFDIYREANLTIVKFSSQSVLSYSAV